MAAAIIPIASELIPVLFPIVKQGIISIERLFGKGTGKDKKQVVVNIAQIFAEALAAAGSITKNPTVEETSNLVEVIFQTLNQAGLVNSPTLPTTPQALLPGYYSTSTFTLLVK